MLSRLILFCLVLLTTLQTHAAQTDTTASEIPPQIARLGRGTANSLDWHPSGNILAVGGSLGVWFYDDTLNDVDHFADVGSIASLVWSPLGNQLATVDVDKTVTLWDVNLDSFELKQVHTWAFVDEEYIGISWSPEGERLAVTSYAGAQVLDANTGKIVLSIPDLKFTLTWHPDGTQIAGVVDLGEEMGSQVRVWDASTGAVIKTYMSEYPDLYWGNIQWSADGSVLVGVTSIPATVHAWDVETGDLLSDVDPTMADFSAYLDMWWLDDSKKLVIASRYVSPPGGMSFHIWNTEKWTFDETVGSFESAFRTKKHPNASIWAILTYDGQIMIWRLGDDEPLRLSSVHTETPRIFAWSPDNQHLATASSLNETVSVWDLSLPDQPQQITAAIPFEGWRLDELRWNGNDKLIGFLSLPEITAPGAFPITFIVEWDARTGKYIGVRHETPGYVAWDGSGDSLPSYTWNHDFTRVVTHLSDQPLTISTVDMSLSPDKEIAKIEIKDAPTKIVWSPDNSMLAVITHDSMDEENSAWVYNAETGEMINRLRSSFFAFLYDISWSPDSSMVALVGYRGIAGSGQTEYRLDVLKVDPSSAEAAHVTTVLDADTEFHHAWHPDSRSIAVSNSFGVGIYPIESAAMGLDAEPTSIIPDVHTFALAWSSDGRLLAGGDEDGTVRIWDVSKLE